MRYNIFIMRKLCRTACHFKFLYVLLPICALFKSEAQSVELSEAEIAQGYSALSVSTKIACREALGSSALPKSAYIEFLHTGQNPRVLAINCANRALKALPMMGGEYRARPWLCILRDIKIALILRHFLPVETQQRLYSALSNIELDRVLAEDLSYENEYVHYSVTNPGQLARNLYNETQGLIKAV